jgi:ABC-type multidrug transport system permease subunit
VSTLAAYGAAAAALVRRDAALYFSYRMAFFTQCVSLISSVTLFYYLSRLVTIHSFGSPDRYFQYVVIGLVIMQTVMGTLGDLPNTVRQELVAGTFERLVLSPFGAAASVLSMVAFPFLRALVFGALMIAFATIAFGLTLVWPTVLLAAPAAALAALAFIPFALFFTAAIFAFKQAPGMSLVMTAIALTSGMYFPTDLLPSWIQWTSDVQPFTPAVDLLRHLTVGSVLATSAWLEVLRLAAFATVLLPVALMTMGAALRFGQRRGTVTEF